MAREIWPYKPRDELLETLVWATDVFRAKSGEQRIALRTVPRRQFTLSHTLTDYEYTGARALIRTAQSADGFLVPDWAQAIALGSVSPDSSYAAVADASEYDFGDTALLWESIDNYEQVTVEYDSNGGALVLVDVTGTYTDARVMPLWQADATDGLDSNRIGVRLNNVSIEFEIVENTSLAATSQPQYRSMDVMPDCPILAGGVQETIGWPTSVIDNSLSSPEYLRQRDIPDVVYLLRWHLSTRTEMWTNRTWLHARRGRQKAFWLSSFGKDYELSSIPDTTTLKIFALPGKDGIGYETQFDIEVKSTDGTSYYRRVTAAAAGLPVDGRDTINLTIDSALSLTLGEVDRISILRSTRFNADRIELLHRAGPSGIYTQVSIPCTEIEEPT